jgi:CxxC motif-containing protein (DUF1111 family)
LYEGESVFNRIGCVDCHVPDVFPVTDLFSDLLLHDMGEELQAASPAPAAGATLAGLERLPRYTVKGPSNGTLPPYYSSASDRIPTAEAIPRPDRPQFPRGPRPVLPDTGETTGQPLVTWDDLQREWRTPPLWGVADTAPYLHDGRAKTLEEAILWHGGEAKQSRDLFAELKPAQKRQLLAFLFSLRAPDQ